MGKFVDKLSKNTPQEVRTVIEKVDLAQEEMFTDIVRRVEDLELTVKDLIDKLTGSQKEDKQKGKKEDKKSE